MSIVNSALDLAVKVASIVDRNNERKYKEQFLDLRRKIEAEELKNDPDDLKLHLLRGDLELLLSAFSNEIGKLSNDDGDSQGSGG